MLQFFEHTYSSIALLKEPIESDDKEQLYYFLEKSHTPCKIYLTDLYSLEAKYLLLLYDMYFKEKRVFSLIVNEGKLFTYLKNLGFDVLLQSTIKEQVVATAQIEVVLIGGSAHSSEKIIQIVKQSSQKNITLVVIQHIGATDKLLFDTILQNYTQERVSYAKNGEKIKKGEIYLAPSDHHLEVIEGTFFLSRRKKVNFSRPSISVSYHSFSNYYGASLLIIQECGYGDDGVDALQNAKQSGATIVVQYPKECKAEAMVTNALLSEEYHFTLYTEEIAQFLSFVDQRGDKKFFIEYLQEMIHKRYHYDFSLYNQEMFQRRLDAFMIKHSIKSLHSAMALILFKKSVFKSLFLELSINVTQFFREPHSYKRMQEIVQEESKDSSALTIWSAGCSSGMEAYSIAILLDQLGVLESSLLYATDFNDVILQEAKNGIYPNKIYESSAEALKEFSPLKSFNSYITQNKHFFRMNENIRKKVLFFQHNLLEDSSFNEFNVIVCKNVLIYFHEIFQNRVIELFYDSLKCGGYLILGHNELLPFQFHNKFKPYRADVSIYKKVIK